MVSSANLENSPKAGDKFVAHPLGLYELPFTTSSIREDGVSVITDKNRVSMTIPNHEWILYLRDKTITPYKI